MIQFFYLKKGKPYSVAFFYLDGFKRLRIAELEKTIEQWVFLGVGGVSRALLEVLKKERPDWLNKAKITLIEPTDIRESESVKQFGVFSSVAKGIYETIDQRCRWLQVMIDESNFRHLLESEVGPNAFIVNLSTRVGTIDILKLAEEKKALYIDTALDWWNDPVTDFNHGYEDSLALLELEMLKQTRHIQTSMVYTYGMNPGIVSSMALVALEKIVQILDPSLTPLIELKQYHLVAERLGLTLIQIAERDCQTLSRKMDPAVCYNTWSPTGFIDEAFDSCAYTLGSHEEWTLQTADIKHREEVLQVFFECPSIDIIATSYEPRQGLLHGRLIPHQEAHTLARFLKNGDYWPTVYYCYEPSDAGKLLLEAARKDRNIPTRFIRSDEIDGGYDSIGCLMYFRRPEGLRTFWIGSIVENKDSVSQEVNATLTQVAGGCFAAISYLIEHPKMGVISPEMIDPHFALKKASPYLGHVDFMEVTAEHQPSSDELKDLIVTPHKSLVNWSRIPSREMSAV